MPNPVTQDQTVQATNVALAQMDPPGVPIANLDTDALSNSEWSCNNFSPTVLDQVCVLTGTNPDNLQTTNYPQGGNLPDSFADATFVNISMLGEPSALNHNFNILVSGPTTYLIQVFVGKQVNIVRRLANADFITSWQNLSNNVNWQASYNTLFGVTPASVVPNPPAATWLSNQYVTL
jgi:hypothetical protein